MARWTEDWKRCSASTKFAKEMAASGPFVDLHHAVRTARHIWLNLELKEWNQKYENKFGFVFLICPSGRSIVEILSELKKRYHSRPIVELETAAHEEMKIIELRIKKLFATTEVAAPSVASVDPICY